MAKLQVFVSHLTVEAKFADLLGSHLQRDFIGLLNLFISTDATSVPVGTDWLQRILASVRSADLHMVLCSSESVKMPWINYECGAAQAAGVNVVPLCHSGIEPEQLPVPLTMSEGVVLTEADGLRKLYSGIAARLSADVPAVDFEAYAKEFQALESEYLVQRGTDDTASRDPVDEITIEEPRVVCAISDQFKELGYKNQLDIVLEAFPQHVEHDIVDSSTDLERVLQQERVDILHVATFVCPRSGLLYFSRVLLPQGSPDGANPEVVRPEQLAQLVETAKTRLVVIASGDSLALVTALLEVTNVIAPRAIVSAKALAVWVGAFYKTLRVQPLAEACEYAFNKSRVPMRLLSQQKQVPAITFKPTD